MHSSSFDAGSNTRVGGNLLVAIAALVTEGRVPAGKSTSKSKGFYEGPHCGITNSNNQHICNPSDLLCQKYNKVRSQVVNWWQKGIPLCVEVLLTSDCSCSIDEEDSAATEEHSDLLLEQWYFYTNTQRPSETIPFKLPQLISAIKSQLYFSQISAWLSSQEDSAKLKLSNKNIKYSLTIPGETFETSKFNSQPNTHNFPNTDLENGHTLSVSLLSLPRLSEFPVVKCLKCNKPDPIPSPNLKAHPEPSKSDSSKDAPLLDDRMQTSCTIKGKHRCDELDDFDTSLKKNSSFKNTKRVCHAKSCGKNDPQGVGASHDCSKSSLLSEPSTSRAELMRKAHENLEKYLPGGSMKPEANKSEKRNILQSDEQNVKSVKLDTESTTAENSFVPEKMDMGTKFKKALGKSQQAASSLLFNGIMRNILVPSEEGMHNVGSQKGIKGRMKENLDVLVGDGSVNRIHGDRSVKCDFKCVHKLDAESSLTNGCANSAGVDTKPSICDKMSEKSDIFNIKHNLVSIYVDSNCDSPIPKPQNSKKMQDISNVALKKPQSTFKGKVSQKITFDDDNKCILSNNDVKCDIKNDGIGKPKLKCDVSKCTKLSNNTGVEIPSVIEQAKFRKSLDNAASMVFHARTGLPLTSSPAPIRRGKASFDFDSSINSVSAIKSALFSGSFSTDEDSESDGSIVSPCSPDTLIHTRREEPPLKYHRKGHAGNLLGTFEESVLNGRLEPVSTVHGFRAELGASGSFVPKHLFCPVTVFFYNLGDSDKVSSPYLGHINLGKKGYTVPKAGTVQVTLFNPLGTVVKMFVIMYDLSDMPPNSQTFIRQRTLYMPTDSKDEAVEWGPKWLRYLIHLRFMSSKSGRIYLHSDIRMIIFRQSDLDTATAHGRDMSYELRSFTHMPSMPKYSTREIKNSLVK